MLATDALTENSLAASVRELQIRRPKEPYLWSAELLLGTLRLSTIDYLLALFGKKTGSEEIWKIVPCLVRFPQTVKKK